MNFVDAPDPMDAGAPITLSGGVHPGCFELFANENIRSITDLKGKSVGVRAWVSQHSFLAVSQLCRLDPPRTSMDTRQRQTIGALRRRKDRCVPGFSRSRRNCGPADRSCDRHSTLDRPWSQYFCCMLAGNADSSATIRPRPSVVLRAILKRLTSASRTQASRATGFGWGVTASYEYALQTMKEVPYQVREYDPRTRSDSTRCACTRGHSQSSPIGSSPMARIGLPRRA